MHKKLHLLLFSSLAALTIPLHAEEEVWCDSGGPISILGEFVYMKRAQIHNHSLVVDPTKVQCPTTMCPDYSILDSKKLVQHFDFEPGYRLGISYLLDRRGTIEMLYMHINEWSTTQRVHDTGQLKFPFNDSSFAYDYINADKAAAHYTSRIFSTEINYWNHMTPRGEDYWSVSAIMGLRFLRLREFFKLTFEKGSDKSDYRVRTNNDLPAAQVGLNLQVNPTNYLSWEAIVKVGPVYNRASNNVFLGDHNNNVTLRSYEMHQWKWALLTEASVAFGFNFWSYANIHIGYDFLYLTNVALAPEQIRKRTAHVGHFLFDKGEVIIHGLFTGLNINF
jgi:hypothetical protein